MQKFYMDELEILLKTYEPGDIKYKPDVLKEIEKRDAERNVPQFAIKNKDGTNKIIPPSEILNILKEESQLIYPH